MAGTSSVAAASAAPPSRDSFAGSSSSRGATSTTTSRRSPLGDDGGRAPVPPPPPPPWRCSEEVGRRTTTGRRGGRMRRCRRLVGLLAVAVSTVVVAVTLGTAEALTTGPSVGGGAIGTRTRGRPPSPRQRPLRNRGRTNGGGGEGGTGRKSLRMNGSGASAVGGGGGEMPGAEGRGRVLMASSSSSSSSSSSGGGGKRGRDRFSAAAATRGRTATAASSSSPLLRDMNGGKAEVMRRLKRGDVPGAAMAVESMMEELARSEETTTSSPPSSNGGRVNGDGGAAEVKNHRDAASSLIDESIQSITIRAFAPPHGSGPDELRRFRAGLDVMKLQLSNAVCLSDPYGDVPRAAWLSALRALTAAASRGTIKGSGGLDDEGDFDPANEAHRILQRLVTGEGVRMGWRSSNSPNGAGSRLPSLDERDFSMVLNAYVAAGRMASAHRVIALQERTERAPPLSPVAYSILIKGYGNLGDESGVDAVLAKARKNGIKSDTVMHNGLIDAYVNCGNVEKAYQAFSSLFDKDGGGGTGGRGGGGGGGGPRPNLRTYNTMLKGFARSGDLDRASELTERMVSAGLWDDVTTNTLVSVAVNAEEFEYAERVLNERTTFLPPDDDDSGRGRGRGPRRRQHPNVEAYTELVDGRVKSGSLDLGVRTLQTMRKNGVEPNVHTYTCLVGGMARARRVDQALRMVDYMIGTGVDPTSVTYNALITGMLSDPPPPTSSPFNKAADGGTDTGDAARTDGANPSSADRDFISADQLAHNERVVQSLSVLRRMVRDEVRPSPIAVAAVVEGLGRCVPPRNAEAGALVSRLEGDDDTDDRERRRPGGMSLGGDERVGTALIRACARGNDFEGASSAFRSIVRPDVVALNAYLDACCKCGRVKTAFESFREYAGRAPHSYALSRGAASKAASAAAAKRGRGLEPDVVTYTVLISALLKTGTVVASRRVGRLYRDMKVGWRIQPDRGLVDTILDAMIEGGPLGLDRQNIRFALSVLKDAETLDWGPGEYEKRRRAVRGVLVGRVSEVWKENEDEFGMGGGEAEEMVDPLFEMKGWNRVDSGFRLWGGGNEEKRPKRSSKAAAVGGGEGMGEGGNGEEWMDEGGEDVDEFLEMHGWNDVDSGFKWF